MGRKARTGSLIIRGSEQSLVDVEERGAGWSGDSEDRQGGWEEQFVFGRDEFNV